jgi:hypothetical protein
MNAAATNGAGSSTDPYGSAFASNALAAYFAMPTWARANAPQDVLEAQEASTQVLGNTQSWNAYADVLSRTPIQKSMEPWSHIGLAAQTVPNAGMLLHQGALPIGMRSALATPNSAAWLGGGTPTTGAFTRPPAMLAPNLAAAFANAAAAAASESSAARWKS